MRKRIDLQIKNTIFAVICLYKLGKTKFILLILLMCVGVFSHAQIVSSNADMVSVVGGDNVYWYKDWSKAIVNVKTDNISMIEWLAFDESTMSYTELKKKTEGTEDNYIATESCMMMCRVTYNEKVSETRFGMDVPMIENVEMTIDSVYCEGMDVTVKAIGEPTRYYNHQTETWAEIAQKMVYSWYVSDTLQVMSGQEELTLESPMSDCEVRVVAANQVENTGEASDSVGSYGVRAMFKYEERERDVLNEVTNGDYYSAPAEISFTSESKGKVSVYEWVMGDMSRVYDKNPVYSFQQTGEHRVKLIVTDEESGCMSADSALTIKVTDAFLNFPDVFTPNGDGVNDEFRCAYKSLKNYDIKIYNRWGRQIYHSTDPAKGWNGKEGNSEAAAGVYMYIAEADGFDKGVKIRRHGSVTIIR